MKKILGVVVLAVLAGCESKQESIVLSANKNGVTYLLDVSKASASISVGGKSKALVVKAFDSDEIMLEDENGNSLNLIKQPALSNWVCDLCVSHDLPVTWK